MSQSFPKIDTYHLIVFYYVCQEKSISAAAEKLFLSQPTVTGHIKSLEESTQTKLIQIDRKKLSLTPIGEGLYQFAKQIFQQTLAADRFIELAKESSLNIGFSPLFTLFIARAIKDMSKQFGSSIKLDVMSGESFNLVKEVAGSKIDLAVVPSMDYGFNHLSKVRIAQNIDLDFFASPSHPIFNKSKIEWTDLGDYPLVVGSEASSVRQMLSAKLSAEGLKTPPRFYLTANNIEFYKKIVQDGKSISISLEEDIHEEQEKGTLKVLPLPGGITLDIDIIAYESHFSTELVQQFVACAKASIYRNQARSVSITL
jgi:LysR family transcriptional regulator, transcriptional activator of the cysJI operon